eukprot:GHVO01059981.1.p1 GENE.GHVO01059981.1~~GHVO01059981.1.p1  ORF type:complete len:122 (-),score=8.90 GHVO01059981.1:115-480(-)
MLQINFRREALQDYELRQGLKLFVEWLNRKNDVWLVTHQEAIEWMKAPIQTTEARDLSNCRILRQYNQGCTMLAKKTSLMAPFAAILKTQYLWTYQSLFLIISYFVILKYDKFIQQKKKKP